MHNISLYFNTDINQTGFTGFIDSIANIGLMPSRYLNNGRTFHVVEMNESCYINNEESVYKIKHIKNYTIQELKRSSNLKWAKTLISIILVIPATIIAIPFKLIALSSNSVRERYQLINLSTLTKSILNKQKTTPLPTSGINKTAKKTYNIFISRLSHVTPDYVVDNFLKLLKEEIKDSACDVNFIHENNKLNICQSMLYFNAFGAHRSEMEQAYKEYENIEIKDKTFVALNPSDGTFSLFSLMKKNNINEVKKIFHVKELKKTDLEFVDLVKHLKEKTDRFAQK